MAPAQACTYNNAVQLRYRECAPTVQESVVASSIHAAHLNEGICCAPALESLAGVAVACVAAVPLPAAAAHDEGLHTQQHSTIQYRQCGTGCCRMVLDSTVQYIAVRYVTVQSSTAQIRQYRVCWVHCISSQPHYIGCQGARAQPLLNHQVDLVESTIGIEHQVWHHEALTSLRSVVKQHH